MERAQRFLNLQRNGTSRNHSVRRRARNNHATQGGRRSFHRFRRQSGRECNAGNRLTASTEKAAQLFQRTRNPFLRRILVSSHDASDLAKTLLLEKSKDNRIAILFAKSRQRLIE